MSNVFQLDDYRQTPTTPSSFDEGNSRQTLSDLNAMINDPAGMEDRPSLGERALLGPNRQTSETTAALLRARSAERMEAMKRSAPPPPAENALMSANPILIHSISWGRNAWNSTWIQRYRSGTLAESHASARDFIEANRVQGSAYKVTVMPGWHLQFDRRAYIVCEINTSTPFSRLRRPAFTDQGILEADALALLDPTSGVWRGAKPIHDSVIVQATKLPTSSFTPWASRSTHPGQARTPGRYERVASGRDWYLKPVIGKDVTRYDTSAFEKLLADGGGSDPVSQ